MLEKSYYAILGLDPHAPTAAIKSQYRRLAKNYHPDLNPDNPQAATQFQELHAAYEVLSDPVKRRLYDAKIGRDWSTKDSYGENSGPRPYRYYDGRGYQRPRTNRPVMKPNRPRAAYSRYTLEVSLPELFKGTKRSLVVGQTFTCGRCKGKGKLLDKDGVICERCGGYGFVVDYRQVEVRLPPGLQPGMQVRLELAGGQPEHPLFDAPAMTDIAVTVHLCDPLPFEYHDNQLYITVQVPLGLLNEGGEWTIPAPEGGQFNFRIPAGTSSGSTLTLRKRGLRKGSSPRRGNLLCTVVAA